MDAAAGSGQPGRRVHVRSYGDLADVIRRLPPRLGAVRLVAIDGPGGSGKTSFARRLSTELGGVTIIETDDFATADEILDWWPQCESRVLEPIADGRPVRFRAYDWQARRKGAWRNPDIGETVILEGFSSSRRAARERLAYAVWIETSPETRLVRALERDGSEAEALWRRWRAEEDAHFASDPTRERADLVVDGEPGEPHDPAAEFVEIELG